MAVDLLDGISYSESHKDFWKDKIPVFNKKKKNWNMHFTSVLTFQNVNIQSWGL